MWKLTVKQALAHRSRLAVTLLAVVLGVAFVSGSLVLTDTSQRLFDDQFRTATAGVDLTIRDEVAFDSAMGVEVDRDPLPAGLAGRVRTVPGVADVRPVAKGEGLIEVDGRPVVPSGPSMLTTWTAAPFGAFAIRDGRAPSGYAEVAVDAATAAQQRIEVGDTVTIRSTTAQRLQVVGLAGFGDRPGLPNTTVALVTLPTAQQLLDLDSAVSEVLVLAADDATPAQLRDRLGRELGPGVEIAGSKDTAAASAAAAKAKLSYLTMMLLALAGAALLVGGFLIANTFSIVVAQRTRELAVLRAGGATARQVAWSVLGEAFLVGIAGSVIGTGLGIVAAAGLRGLTGAFGVELPDGGSVVSPQTLLIALGVGVLVTIVSAIGPARRAGRVAPLEAMRQSDTMSRPAGRLRVLAGGTAVLLAASAGAMVAAGAGPVGLLGLAGVLALVGLTLLGPVLVPRLARVVGRPLDAAGAAGRLARDSAVRAPRRTSATAMALALGLALITFMAIVATSVKGSIHDTYDDVITADYVIESARAEMLGGLSPQVHHHVSRLPEVEATSRLRYGHWQDRGTTSALTAVDPATLPKVARVDMVDGSIADLAGGGIVVAEQVARKRAAAIGDRLPMTFSRTGDQRLRIVGLIADDDAQALSTDYLISLDTFARHFSEDVDASVFVGLADGVGVEQARKAIETALADQPTAQLRDEAAAKDGRAQTVDQILGLVTALLLLAILIALLGITNTLAMAIVERTREIGLLRAVGMTRQQLRWMVRGEAALVAALAVVLGVGLGTAFGAVTVAALARTAAITLVLPIGQLVLVVAVATVAGLVAGLLPARRAARLDVLTAIGTE